MGGMPWRRGSRWLRRWERNAVKRSGGRPAWPTCREKEVVEGGRRQTGERGSGGDEAREAGRQEMSVDHRRRWLREQGAAVRQSELAKMKADLDARERKIAAEEERVNHLRSVLSERAALLSKPI